MDLTVQGDEVARHSRRASFFAGSTRAPAIHDATKAIPTNPDHVVVHDVAFSGANTDIRGNTASPTAIPLTDSKTDIRRRLREQRRAVTPAARRVAAQELAERLSAVHAFRVARRIACYLPSDGEIDPYVIREHIERFNKRCYLPVLSRIDYDRLWFAPADTKAPRVPNRFGILEPRVPPRQLVRARELDLILLPLVAFDGSGQRLGMGGGFFDRSLAFLGWRAHWRKPRLIGLAYDFQKVAALPHEPWDVPLDAIVTDRDIYATPAV